MAPRKFIEFMSHLVGLGIYDDVYIFQVVKADIFDPDSMVAGMTGQDAVLSCLGCPPSFLSWRKITFYTDTAKTIVAAMRKASVSRLIFMSSWHSVCKLNG